jgi:hypothetical protein
MKGDARIKNVVVSWTAGPVKLETRGNRELFPDKQLLNRW